MTTELYCPACHGTSTIAGVLLLAPGSRHIVCPLCGAEFNVTIEFWSIDELGHRQYEDAVSR
jgi:formate dehydrogenase maturation protein FdhE